MREINFGPVANPDGTPSDITREMLAGTGRDPNEFAALSLPRKKAIDKMHTTNAIALIALARELLDIQQGSVDDALALLDDGAGLSAAERDVVTYWLEVARTEEI